MPYSFGQYKAYYESPRTRKKWCCLITDMDYVDKFKEDYPSKAFLHELKRHIKRNGVLQSR